MADCGRFGGPLDAYTRSSSIRAGGSRPVSRSAERECRRRSSVSAIRTLAAVSCSPGAHPDDPIDPGKRPTTPTGAMAAEAEAPAPAPPPSTTPLHPPRDLLEAQLQVEYEVARLYQAIFTRRPLDMWLDMSIQGKRGLCVVEFDEHKAGKLQRMPS